MIDYSSAVRPVTIAPPLICPSTLPLVPPFHPSHPPTLPTLLPLHCGEKPDFFLDVRPALRSTAPLEIRPYRSSPRTGGRSGTRSRTFFRACFLPRLARASSKAPISSAESFSSARCLRRTSSYSKSRVVDKAILTLRFCRYNGSMDRTTVRIHRMDEYDEVRGNLRYWLSRPPEERLAAVDELRQQFYGNPQRLQRVARVVQQAQG